MNNYYMNEDLIPRCLKHDCLMPCSECHYEKYGGKSTVAIEFQKRIKRMRETKEHFVLVTPHGSTVVSLTKEETK